MELASCLDDKLLTIGDDSALSDLLPAVGFERGCSFVCSLAGVGGVQIDVVGLLGIPRSSDRQRGKGRIVFALTRCPSQDKVPLSGTHRLCLC